MGICIYIFTSFVWTGLYLYWIAEILSFKHISHSAKFMFSIGLHIRPIQKTWFRLCFWRIIWLKVNMSYSSDWKWLAWWLFAFSRADGELMDLPGNVEGCFCMKYVVTEEVNMIWLTSLHSAVCPFFQEIQCIYI